MPQDVRRGYDPSDARLFSADALPRLRRAQQDIVWLLDRGYGLEQSVTFVGNRFQLAARQRAALTRATCPTAVCRSRREKERPAPPPGTALAVDGLNLIITLETVLSGSTVLHGMDGTLRDLCGLRGNYRIIARTLPAVRMAVRAVSRWPVGELVWVLDAPVSNSGRLAGMIRAESAGCPFPVRAELIDRADERLAGSEWVVTADSAVLDRCRGWINLAWELASALPGFSAVELGAAPGGTA